MNNANGRMAYYDGLKLLAVFLVFATHFINYFHKEYFLMLEASRIFWFAGGLSGKFGVSIFSVTLGFFAYNSSEGSITKYTFRRFLYFFVSCLFINCIFSTICKLEQPEQHFEIWQILYCSITLSDKILPTLWCIRPFFISSVISIINGKTKPGICVLVLEIIVLSFYRHIWTAICIMGNLVTELQQRDVLKNLYNSRMFRVFVYLITLLLINRPESNPTYIVYGLCAAAIITVMPYSNILRKILEFPLLSSPGMNTMAIYLIHGIIYKVLGNIIGLPNNPAPYFAFFISAFISSWLLSVLLSYPITMFLNILTRLGASSLDYISSVLEKYWQIDL